MARVETRLCPQCNETKPFRLDQKTCGCPKPPQEKVTDTTTAGGRVRNIEIDATRICNEEQLIEALQIDMTKWYVDSFVVRKWEMGYVKKETSSKVKDKEKGTEDGTKNWVSAHHQLFAVACKLKRVVSERDAEGYVKENVRLMKENKRLSFQLKSEKRYRNQYIETTGAQDEMMSQLREIVQRAHESMKWNPTVYKVSQPETTPQLCVDPDHSEDAVALFSDWHLGDVIRPGDTSGFPSFNLPIAGNRLGYVVKQIKRILTKHRAMYPIKKLVIWFGGDMGNGDLHDAPLSNCLFIGDQIHFTFIMAKMALEDLLTLTIPDPETGLRVVEKIEVLFTCGNHMREATAKFMPMKYQAQRTFDGLIYKLLMTWIDDYGSQRISYKNEMSPYIFHDIRGHRYGFAHGMQVGYKNSPDAQCKSMDSFMKTIRSLFDSPEFRRKNGLQGATFSRMCIGDIHVPVDFPRLTSNASLNGQNELGANWGLEPIPAGQKLFGVTEKHIQTWGYIVECSQVQDEVSDRNVYGEFALDYADKYGRR
jgi:hypothetical protein